MTRPVQAFDWIAHHADLTPDSVALVDDGRDLALTYRDLEDRVRRLAAWLRDNGIGAGDRVAFLSENTTDTFEALFACAKLTAILVPLNWRLALPELEFNTQGLNHVQLRGTPGKVECKLQSSGTAC